jgi:hypothetical protein
MVIATWVHSRNFLKNVLPTHEIFKKFLSRHYILGIKYPPQLKKFPPLTKFKKKFSHHPQYLKICPWLNLCQQLFS